MAGGLGVWEAVGVGVGGWGAEGISLCWASSAATRPSFARSASKWWREMAAAKFKVTSERGSPFFVCKFAASGTAGGPRKVVHVRERASAAKCGGARRGAQRLGRKSAYGAGGESGRLGPVAGRGVEEGGGSADGVEDGPWGHAEADQITFMGVGTARDLAEFVCVAAGSPCGNASALFGGTVR